MMDVGVSSRLEQKQMWTQKCKDWLENKVFPLWSTIGFDQAAGGFVESINLDGSISPAPRRALVQSRQIYSFHMGLKLGLLPTERASKLILSSADYLLNRYRLPSGAISHAITADGAPKDSRPDLYTQAFSLFGLASAYAISGDEKWRQYALQILQYLDSERKTKHGGYTEFSEANTLVYRSNPHMHLFEALLYWMMLDKDNRWRAHADEILHLCLNKFISKRQNFLAEFFSDDWAPLVEERGFIAEPGHHFEWSWLLSMYQEETGTDLSTQSKELFYLGERFGVCTKRNAVIDEIWSDGTPQKTSARLWPQCERIKAALSIAEAATDETSRTHAALVADQAMDTLFQYLNTPIVGLWNDQWYEDGTFDKMPARASSLYHIIGAMKEYIEKRDTI